MGKGLGDHTHRAVQWCGAFDMALDWVSVMSICAGLRLPSSYSLRYHARMFVLRASSHASYSKISHTPCCSIISTSVPQEHANEEEDPASCQSQASTDVSGLCSSTPSKLEELHQ
ncbi:hypothetical protein HAX54_002840 [Datura stramonium]|uniref:Uncharacterized protein n=1 Tax=Datura stramonium TaxID=4076 RepID=A0ABS8WU22_DATST|nr:hypothetical protein [Datura stramonium]